MDTALDYLLSRPRAHGVKAVTASNISDDARYCTAHYSEMVEKGDQYIRQVQEAEVIYPRFRAFGPRTSIGTLLLHNASLLIPPIPYSLFAPATSNAPAYSSLGSPWQ